VQDRIPKGMAAWAWRSDKRGVRPFHIDPTQHATVVIDAEHHEVHEGHMYHYTYINTDVDIITPVQLTLTTPAEFALGDEWSSAVHGGETYVHLAAEVYASGQVQVDFREGGTVTGGVDDTAAIKNRNRDLKEVNLQSTIKTGVSLTGGTLLSVAIVGNAGNPVQRAAGTARTGLEWMLDHDEDYTLVITPAQNDTLVVVNFDFYEHIHKDDWAEENIMSENV